MIVVFMMDGGITNEKIILIALVSCNLSAHNLKMITLNENGLPPVDSGLTLHRESTVGRLDKSIPNVFIYSQMIADNALFEMSTKREPWALVAPDLDPNGITDIKLNLSDVKLDFQYKAKKYPADYKLQGFAVNGTVDKDGRWSGISEFFILLNLDYVLIVYLLLTLCLWMKRD